MIKHVSKNQCVRLLKPDTGVTLASQATQTWCEHSPRTAVELVFVSNFFAGALMKKLNVLSVASMLLIAALWLGHGSANAIVFKAIVDPAFNPGGTSATGTDLGWSAEMFFDLDGCAPGLFTTCSTMNLLSATGTLYDTTDLSHTPVSTPSTLTYFAGPPNNSLIHSVLFDGSGGVLG